MAGIAHSYCYKLLLGVYHRVEDEEALLTPMQATDSEETITIVTPSGSLLTWQIETDEVTAVQETNPAIQGQMTFKNFSIPLKQWQ